VSKARVWNKGKRNGGGGPPKTDKAPGISKEIDTVPKININVEHRTERIKPMSRDNWVSRPARPNGHKPGIAAKEDSKE
jgi:hypothetical protein